MRGFPERSDFLSFTPTGKSVMLDGVGDQPLEILEFRILAASLPVRD